MFCQKNKVYFGALGFLFLLSCSRTGFDSTKCDGGVKVDGGCYVQECEDRHCPKDFVCRDGICAELNCFDVVCEAYEACVKGQCYPKTCATKSCPGWGEVCIEDTCTPGTCIGVECPEGQRCANGFCYPVDCETEPCSGKEEVCFHGACEQRSCVGANCPQGQRCAQGYCYPIDCEAEPCTEDLEVCFEGRCVSRRCVGVACPEGEECVEGECKKFESCPMGDGTFGPKADYVAGGQPRSVTMGDFNADGILDLAVTNTTLGSVGILLGKGSSGRGDGTFAARVDYPVIVNPWSITAGDFNTDGILDLAVANYTSTLVSVLLGNGSSGRGDGTFALKVDYVAGTNACFVTTGDFNADGILDLVVASWGTSISVLLGNGSGGRGDGTFAAKVDYVVGNNPHSVVTGDFNADGILDLAVANTNSNDVSVFLGNGSGGGGDGTFAPRVDYGAGTNPRSVAAGDFNADGILDLATANNGSDNISVLLGNGSFGRGNGTFATKVDYTAGDGAYFVTAGDFNFDGILDLAVANEYSANVSVLLGNGGGGRGDGTFATKVDYPAGTNPISVITGDFNADGILDLAAANQGSQNVSVLLGNGSGGLGNGAFATKMDYHTGSAPVSVISDDFNADSVLDLVVANSGSASVSVFLGNGDSGRGDGRFMAKVDYVVGDGPWSVVAGDFNSDSILDLAVANVYPNNISVLLGNGTGGQGDGTFAPRMDYPTGAEPRSVTVGDFNADSILDLAVANDSSGNVSVLLGNGSNGSGNGTFAPKVDYTAGVRTQSVITGDFNADKILDLVTVNATSTDVSILLGNGGGGRGDGTFASKVDYPTGSWSLSLATGDFNADSILDLVVANAGTNSVGVFLGNGNGGRGDGTFAISVNYPTGTSVFVTTGDFNADSIVDLAATNSDFDNVSVLLGNGSGGRGNGTFAAKVDYPMGITPVSVTAGDFNADGILDLAVANADSDNISVLLGNGACQ
jgi:hypothetical protein